MKKTIKKISILLFTVFFISCQNIDFGDTNVDPNGPTAAVTSQLLTQAQISVVGTITGTKGVLYTQQLTEGQYPGFSKYSASTFNYNGWYTGPLQNLNEIIKLNEDSSTAGSAAAYGDNNNQIAVAKILKSYFLQYMTDNWGGLPLSEAFQGIAQPQPKFDTQEEIYNFIFSEIETALTLIDVSKSGPSGDVILKGNMNRWKVFANSLKMVAALRVSDIKPALAKTKFEEAVATGNIITENSDNILYTFGSDDNSDNPWEDRFETREDYIMSETMTETLRSNLDPRLFKYAEPSRDGTFPTPAFPGNIDAKYVGAENGKVNGDVPNYSFPTNTVIKDQTYKSPIYTASQMNFSLAEAKLKGWSVGSKSAAEFYNTGIEEAMKFWNVDQSDITAYITAHPFVDIKSIAYEKWISLYLSGHEAWSEWRRLDWPQLTPSTYAADSRIPVRDAYDSSVEDNNKANYDAIVATQGPDNLYTKLWWDVN